MQQPEGTGFHRANSPCRIRRSKQEDNVMQVILHTGVHCTDDDRILKCLLRNAESWRHDGIAVPGPGKYRQLLSDTVNNLGDAMPAPGARDVVMDAILAQDPEQVDRVLLSHENLFGVPKLLLGGGRLYRKAESRINAICRLFEGDRVEVYMGLRNPATFLPAMMAATPFDTMEEFLNGTDPMHLRWSDLLRRITDANPGLPVTVWCNEDTPLIWGEIIRDMAGIEMTRRITGGFDVFADIVSAEGVARFRTFLKEHPNINEMQRRRVMTAFLDKYAIEDQIEEELDLPGWDDAYIDALTEIYEDDLYRIEHLPGVTVITP